ncbi:PTS sugar transporter subunit IIA [Parasalinivibrio latis]|uniref:PTS sugar transporter subunit IIA n=1 Tax=Parasalinivibrio latis TaxID=2952610 RepID=UPI0030E0BD78
MKDVFSVDHILHDTCSTTKEQAFSFIAQHAEKLGYVTSAELYEAGLRAREQESSTGFTGGVAIPHSKNPAVSHAGIFLVRFSHPIEWETMDDEPVETAVAMSIPADGDEENIRLLTRLSRAIMRAPFREVLRSGDAGQIQQEISEVIAG